MDIQRTRFDDHGEGFRYRGWHLRYEDAEYSLSARQYDEQPDTIVISCPPDPPRVGFGMEVPYEDPRFARAVREMLSASSARRVSCLDCGQDGTTLNLDLGRLIGDP